MSMQHPLGSHAADLAELRLVQALLAKAESSLAAANAENERLRDALEASHASTIDQGYRAGAAESRLAAATALVREWSNFDFDCPDEYNDATGEDEDDGWALDQLYEKTARLLASQPAAPDYATAAQSASELMARVHAPLPGWDNIERRTAAPARTVERLPPRHIPEDQLVPAEEAPPTEWVGMSDAEIARPTPWAAIRRAIGVVGGPPADAVQDCAAAPTRTEAQLDSAIAAVKSYREVVARTEAEQAVLGRSKDVAEGALRWLLKGSVSVDLMDWAAAELARRGLK